MPDLPTRLIETAVRPFSDNAEMKLAATHLLGEVVRPDPPGAEAAIRRWVAVDSQTRGMIWKSALWILLAVVSIGVGVRDFREVSRYVAWRGWVGGVMASSMPEPDAAFVRGLSAEQKLLFGDDPKLPRSEALWHLDPDNPAHFAEYAVEYATEFKTLPPDFLEIARRLDPENAWFTWFAASVEVKGALENKSAEHKEADGTVRVTDTWKVLDQARVDRASALIAKARIQPKCENYASEMLLNRQALFPNRNLIDRMDGIGQISNASHVSNLKLMEAAFFQVARSRLAVEAGDVAGFQDACQTGERFLRHLAGSEVGTMLNGVIEIGYLASLSKTFAEGAERLALEPEAGRWRQLVEAFVARKSTIRANVSLVDGKVADPQLVAGTLYGISLEGGLRVVESPPPLTDADLKPGRLLDHEILSRFCSYVSWIVMGLCLAAVAAYRFRVSRLVRRLSGRMVELLDGGDWAWILGAGVLLPLAYMLAVNRLTPLGGRDFGMLGNGMLLPAGHFVGLILLWLTVPTCVTKWRLAKGAGGLGFTTAGWLGWLAVVSAAAFIPLIGWAAISQSSADFWSLWMGHLGLEIPSSASAPWRFWIAVGMLAVPLLWVIFCIFRALLSRTRRVIHHTTVARVQVQVFTMAILLLASLTTGFKVAENHWFQRETLGKIDPVKPGWSAFEHEVAAQMRRELTEILGDDP